MAKAPLDLDEVSQKGAQMLDLLGAVQRAAAVGYWHVSPTTGTVKCSKTLCALVGQEALASADHVNCAPIFERIHPDDRRRVEFAIRRAMSLDEHEFRLEHRIVRADGEVRHVLHRGFERCTDDTGAPVLLATMQEIPAELIRRSRVDAQQDSVSAFVDVVPDLLGALPDIIVLKDGQGRWLIANDFARNLFNLEGNDYQFKTDEELALTSKRHRDAHLTCARTDEIAWERHELSVQDESIVSADGLQTRIFETMKIPLFNEDGSRKALMVLGRDVSERRRADSQNRRLGRILDDSYNEIYMVDPRTMRFSQVNRGARLNLGYSAAELLQMTPADITNQSLEFLRSRVRPLLEGSQRLVTFEATHVRKNGSTYPVEVRLLLSHTEPQPVFVAIAQDISERKRADRIKDEFISIVSHELRTPLTPILGVLEVLGTTRASSTDDNTAQMVAVAYRNAVRLRRLIDQLLDYRELSTGHASFEMLDLEVGDVVRQAIRTNDFLHQRYEFTLDLEAAGEKLWVNADLRYLVQLLSILLSNAVKFSPPGATIKVCVLTDGEHARIAITDEGPGIREEMREQIFDRFVQGDSTATRAHGGTGLGLALARVIVENFSGTIDFERGDDGAGTTFYVELPLVKKA